MQNTNLDNIALSARRLAKWVEVNSESEEELKKLSASLITRSCRLSNRAQEAHEVLPLRTTIGVFGASQAGKSYLVSNIAAAGGELATYWDGVKIPFLTYMNPPGGDKEATGIVTRFTHEKDVGIEGYPIEVRVLKEHEIAMILVNSFFSDINLPTDVMAQVDALYTKEHWQEHFKKCSDNKDFALAEGETGESAENVVALADYVIKRSKGDLAKLAADSEFWSQLRTLAAKLNVKGRAELYSILWGHLKTFSLMFRKVALELVKLEGHERIYLPKEAFVTERPDGSLQQRAGGTVNAISVLIGLFGNEDTLKVCIDKDSRREVEVNFACFAAATLELKFPLSDGTRVDDFDVLDFPGARSRDRVDLGHIRDGEAQMQGELPSGELLNNCSEFIRRGKVAYLFERYNRRREIDVLLFCINCAAQLEVSDLPVILAEWIDESIGSDANERAKFERVPLIGVLTRFDEAFSKQMNNTVESADMGLDIVKPSFEKFTGQKWFEAWTPGQPFKQIFFVRKPCMPGNTSWLEEELAEDGKTVLKELAVKPGNQKRFDLVLRNLKSDDKFISHVYAGPSGHSQEDTLNAVFTLNDGGVTFVCDFIVSNFKGYADSKQRILNSVSVLSDDLSSSLSVFANFAAAGDSSRVREEATDIANFLLQCDQVSRCLSDIRRLLEPDFDTLLAMYKENYQNDESNAALFARKSLDYMEGLIKDLAAGNGYSELLEIIWKAWEKKRVLFEAEASSSTVYAAFYSQEKGAFYKNKSDFSKALSKIMQKYTGELLKAVHSREFNMEQELKTDLEPNEKLGLPRDELALGQVTRVLRRMSDFMVYLGRICWRSLETEDSKDREESLLSIFDGTSSKPFAEPFEVTYGHPDVSEAYINSYGLRSYRDHFSALCALMEGANQSVGSRYNITGEQNRELCTLLGELKTVAG